MNAKIYLAGLFLLLIAPSFALGESFKRDNDAWEEMYGKVDWIEVLEKKGLKVVPADSEPKKKNLQLGKADKDELTILIQKSLAEFREAEKLGAADRCHKITDSDLAFNNCISSDKRVLSSQGRQNLKKALAPGENNRPMPSLDAMGNATGVE